VSRTIGSSDVAVILGVSPFGSAWDVWSRVRGDVGYDQLDTASMARGRMLETALLARYGLDLGLSIVPGPAIHQAPVVGPEPWMHDRPDAWAGLAGAPPDRVVEAKTSHYLDAEHGWGVEGTDQVPLHYLVQTVWHMACCDLPRCDLVAFGTVRDDLRVYTIRRDLALEKKVVNKARAWYQRHIEGDLQPPADDTEACRRALAAAYRARNGEKSTRPVREADDGDLHLVERLRDLRAAEDDLEAQRKTIEAQLMQRLGEAGELRTRGGVRLVTWSDRKGRESLDSKALRRDHPEIAAKYTTTSAPTRAFKLES
jgi:putative phage-type endonuclease